MAIEFPDEPQVAQEEHWPSVPAGFADLIKPPPESTTAPDDVQAVSDPVEVEVPDALPEEPQAPNAPPQAAADPTVQTLLDGLAQIIHGARPPQLSGQAANDGPELILSLLHDSHAQVIRSIAFERNYHIAEVIAGVLTVIGDRGELGDVRINPQWRERLFTPVNAGGPVTAAPMVKKCEHCKQDFTIERNGDPTRRFCCNKCGQRAVGYREKESHSVDCKTPAAKLVRRQPVVKEAA